MDKASSTRDNIVQAALTLFSGKGYLGATTKEISREAGVSEVTLFRYFSNKEKLLEEVIDKYSFLPALKGLMSDIVDLPYEEALTVIANRLLDFLVMRKDWIRIMHAEMQRSSEEKQRAVYHGLMDEFFDTLAAYFSAMQQKGTLLNFNPAYGARAFHGMFFTYFNMEEMLMRKEYRPTERAEVVREFVGLFAHGTLNPLNATGASRGTKKRKEGRPGGEKEISNIRN